jgi:hypothetical protein
VSRNRQHKGDYRLPDKQKTQLDRFKEAALQLETDDDEERFEERLKKLAKQKLTDDSDSESMKESGGDS